MNVLASVYKARWTSNIPFKLSWNSPILYRKTAASQDKLFNTVLKSL